MTQPLALVFYQKLLPGSQLANQLKDINYRVQTFSDSPALMEVARTDGPMIIFVDLDSAQEDVPALIQKLRQDASTSHLPIVAFSGTEARLPLAQQAGAALAVGDNAMLSHLPDVLEQALRIE